jgi:hypothetical protein
MPRLKIQVAGNKGGAGKSLCSTAVIDCLSRHGHAVALAERDTGNNDCARLFRETIPVRLIGNDPVDAEQQVKKLAESFPDRHIIINSRAAEINIDDETPVIADFNKVARETGSRFICLWMLTAESEKDGLLSLTTFLKACSGQVIVLHNSARGGPLSFWHESEVKKVVERQGGRLIEFPLCATYLRHQISNFRRSPEWMAAHGPSFLHKIAIAHWRKSIDKMMGEILK